MGKQSQIRSGAVISYIAIAFNIVSGLIYTPWMIGEIGQSNYGLYTLATSLITMFLMDFGMSSAVTKFVSEYLAKNDEKNINNFLGLVYKLYIIIDAVILAVVVCVFFFLDSIYANLSPEEFGTFKNIYIIVGLFSVVSFPFTNLNGILTAYEKFVPLKLCDLFNKGFIIIAMVTALALGGGVYSLVIINALAGLITIAIKLIIIKKETNTRVNFKFFDRKMLGEVFGFSIWSTVASVMQRLIFNLTPSIIVVVSVTGAAGAAIFGISSTIESYVYTFAAAMCGMFIARVSRIVAGNESNDEIMSLMVKVGRIILIIVGFVVTAFIAMGKSFIVDIWHKPDFVESYYCTVLLIIPAVFHMPMEIANIMLIVQNKVKLQAGVCTVMGVVNILCALVLSRYCGALGASASIFIAYMVRTILFTVVYSRVLRLRMGEFFKKTYFKLIPCFVIVCVVGIIAETFNPMTNVYIRFMTNGCIFTAVFALLMYFWGFNRYEKDLFGSIFKFLKGRG